MAGGKKPPEGNLGSAPRTTGALPFALGDDEWESELAAWDAQLPAFLDSEADGSASPREENPFSETSTTVVSDVPALLNRQEAVRGEFDANDVPNSGVYASITAFDEDGDNLFQQEPPAEIAAPVVVEPLPEMAGDFWRGELRKLIATRDVPPAAAPDGEYWKRWGRLLTDELSVADTAAAQVDLTMASARVAELGGDLAEALRLYDDALTLQPAAAAAVRARVRILESQGHWQAAIQALDRLTTITGGEERELYRATLAEWRLGRGGARAEDLDALPAGLARALAVAELALRRGDHVAVASAFEDAAQAIGGAAGAALLTAAARFSEAGGDRASAAAERFVAARLAATLPVALGRLRDAARPGADGTEEAVADALRVVPPGLLRSAVARWGAILARRRGDLARARTLLADPELAPSAESAALIRERVELAWVASPALPGLALALPPEPAAGPAFVRAAALWTTPEARAALDARRARWLAARGQEAEALVVLQQALEACPEAMPLALAAEQLASVALQPATRAAAYRLWSQFDPARAAAGLLAVADVLAGADALDATGGAPDGDGDGEARAALRDAMAAAPGSATFWRLAARQLQARNSGAAAETLASGAAAWGDSALASVLRERADELRATPAPAARGPIDVAGQLARSPGDPTALALLSVDSATAPEVKAGAWWKAAPGDADDTLRRVVQLQAVSWWECAGEPQRALALAIELEAANPGWSPARSLVRRLSRHATDAVERATIRARLRFDGSDQASALAVAEALEQLGRLPEAGAIFATLADGPLDADAQRGVMRSAGGAPPPVDLAILLGDRPPAPPGIVTAADEADAADAAHAADTAPAATTVSGGEQRSRAIERLAEAIARGSGAAAARSAAALLVQAAAVRDVEPADRERRLRAALAYDPTNLPGLVALRLILVDRADPEAIAVCEREADCETVSEHRVSSLLRAADLALRGDGAVAGDPERAAQLLQKALAIAPEHQETFERLRDLLEKLGAERRLADVLGARIAAAANPFEVTALRLARADLLAGPLGDAAAARDELAAVLAKEPQHARALARLAELHYEAGAFTEAAELYISRARSERSPERLREIFLRLGRIYTQHTVDAKRGIGAYARVLQLEADNREALDALAELYVAQGELKNALAVTQRLVDVEPDAGRRSAYLIRVGQLWEKSGDLRQAGARFRRAVDEAPTNGAAIAEMARYLQRTHDAPGQRALLDQSLLVLRRALAGGDVDLASLRTVAGLLQARGKTIAAAAATQLVAALEPEGAERQAVLTWAAPPADTRRLGALARTVLDDRTFAPEAPPGIRNIFRIIGETLSQGAADIKRWELSRGDRVARGQPPRDIIDPIAEALGAGDFDVYVRPARHHADLAPLVAVPGAPPVLILGAPILKLGPSAVRFAGARTLRLTTTHLDLVLAAPPSETGALIGALVREFVADFQHPDLPDDLIKGRGAQLAKTLPRKIRQEVMPFALESASQFSPTALADAVRDGANAVGLLASGDLPACLSVILAASRTAAGSPLSLTTVRASGEALALLSFALSDAYDDLCRAME